MRCVGVYGFNGITSFSTMTILILRVFCFRFSNYHGLGLGTKDYAHREYLSQIGVLILWSAFDFDYVMFLLNYSDGLEKKIVHSKKKMNMER